jgi:hypothetical protein
VRVCMCVCMCLCTNTFFYKEYTPNYTVFFVTHFLICHSFLDSYIKAKFGAKSQGRDLAGKTAQNNQGAQSHSRTVPLAYGPIRGNPFCTLAYGPIRGNPFCTLAYGPIRGPSSQSHVHTQSSHSHENFPARHFTPCCKKIEMD